MPVHVAHKMQALSSGGKRIQRQHRHLRPEVGATNANIHHIGDGAVGPHGFGISQHRIQRGVHLGQFMRYVFSSYRGKPIKL